jgi:hypothetical protein
MSSLNFNLLRGNIPRNVVCFLLGNSPASEVYMLMFQNTLSLCTHAYLPVKLEQTECSKTSAYKLQTLGNYPKESIQYLEHGKSLKSRIPRKTFHVFTQQGELLHFKTFWIISVLFSTKCCIFCNF